VAQSSVFLVRASLSQGSLVSSFCAWQPQFIISLAMRVADDNDQSPPVFWTVIDDAFLRCNFDHGVE